MLKVRAQLIEGQAHLSRGSGWYRAGSNESPVLWLQLMASNAMQVCGIDEELTLCDAHGEDIDNES